MTVAQVKHPVQADKWVPARADLLLDTLVRFRYADPASGQRQLAARLRRLVADGIVKFVEVV